MAKSVFDFGESAFLSAASAIVTIENHELMTVDKRVNSVTIEPKNKKKAKIPEQIKFVPNGRDNGLPFHIMEKCIKNVHVASGLEFNSLMYYGDGIIVCKKVKDTKTGEVKFQEQLPSEITEISKFLEENNYVRQIQEYGVDMATFYDAFCELILNREDKPKIVQLRHKEYTFSRISEVNPVNGKIEYHGYSAYWYNQKEKLSDSVTATFLLDESAPIYDLKQRIGLIPDDNGKNTDTGIRRFVMRLSKPVPGRLYYNKPYWWSIFESGWYDFACAIPKFKRALLKNQMTFKYHIQIKNSFWSKLYTSQKVKGDPEKEKQARQTWYENLEKYLTGEENAAKTFTSEFEYDLQKGTEVQDIIIKVIDNPLKGGEYLDDSEEAANIIFSAMHIHPSVMGASPGKGKNINGTEARELFIIKQALTKPIRDLLVLPLYVAKAINGWDPDLHFIIPNIMLTTLDQGTGAIKSIGAPKV